VSISARESGVKAQALIARLAVPIVFLALMLFDRRSTVSWSAYACPECCLGRERGLSHGGPSAFASPITGIEKLDFKAMLDGRFVLDNTPVMYWYLSYGAFGDGNMPIPEGFYTVIAHEQRGAVSLRDAKDTTVAAGNLGIGIGPQDQPSGTTAMSVSGGSTA